MTLYETLRKNLTPEDFTKVTDALGDDFDWDLVPRARLNKVIGQRNELRKKLAEGSQPQGTPNGDEDDDDQNNGGNPNPGAPAGKTVDEAALRKAFDKEKADAVQAVKIQYAAVDKLRAAGAIDADLIWAGGLIDKTKLGLDAMGALTGMDELITGLKTSKAHLFGKADDGVPSGTGKSGEDPFKGVTDKASFLKLDATQQMAYKQANPEMFKRFLSE